MILPMPPKKSYLAQLLGTGTKVRILEHLFLDPTPVSTHALSKKISNSIGPVYEQVDQLIALGVLKEVGKKITPDESYPFHDDIMSIVTSTTQYMDIRTLLDRVDSLFGDGYYITGYLAARQNGQPVDHDQDSALIAILHPRPRYSRFLSALSAVAPADVLWYAVNTIPVDITRQDIYGATIWIASTERGLIDCILHHDCSTYVVALLLLQNFMENTMDLSKLLMIAEGCGVGEIPVILLSEFSRIAGNIPIPFEKLNVKEARAKMPDPELSALIDASEKAYNTLMGG